MYILQRKGGWQFCAAAFVSVRKVNTMCMGCAGIAIMNSDGKTPDTTETIVYLGLFALWIMVLVHLKKSPSEQGAETQFNSS